MPALSTAEHARVLRETKDARNAAARARREAWAWVEQRGGTVEPPHREGAVYVVRVPGFARVQDISLVRAVATLRWTVAHWTGTHGPTGALLRRTTP